MNIICINTISPHSLKIAFALLVTFSKKKKNLKHCRLHIRTLTVRHILMPWYKCLYSPMYLQFALSIHTTQSRDINRVPATPACKQAAATTDLVLKRRYSPHRVLQWGLQEASWYTAHVCSTGFIMEHWGKLALKTGYLLDHSNMLIHNRFKWSVATVCCSGHILMKMRWS
jgi:hypothetical protein